MLWKAEVNNQIDRKIKYLRSGNGTWYSDSNLKKLRQEHDIHMHFLVRKTPQQNGVVKRMNMSINKRARCLLLNVEISKGF